MEKKKSKEEILDDISQGHENKYSSFPSLVENEMSLEVYDVVTKAMEAYKDQELEEMKKENEQLRSRLNVAIKVNWIEENDNLISSICPQCNGVIENEYYPYCGRYCKAKNE